MGTTTSTNASTLGKVMPLTSYIEPEVYALVQISANDSNKSASAWVRQLVVTELVRLGRITPEMLVKMAAA